MIAGNELKSERYKLLQQSVTADSSQKLLTVQIAIAKTIRRTEESMLNASDTTALQFHIRRLRLYADSIVWRVLHPHVIRQMAKNAVVPKSLFEQREAFDLVLQSALRHFEQRRVPVLIADITNVIKIGDLVVVTNTEAPMIVESKKKLPKPQHLMQGRRGRQISRALATLKYLREGSAQSFGGDTHLHVVESQHKAQRNWEVISEVGLNALRDGWAEVVLSDHEVMWAYTRGHGNILQTEIQKWHKETSPQFFGTSLGLMNRSDGLFPPPGVWPIPLDVRFALLEEEMILAHLLDLAAFECVRDGGEAIRVEMSEDSPVRVTTFGREYPLSLRFVYDVLYGFETVESCIDGLFEFARRLHETSLKVIGESSQGKPSMYPVTTTKEAMKVMSMGYEIDDDLVAMDPELLARIGSSKVQDKDVLFQGPDHGAYVIMTVREFRSVAPKLDLTEH